VKEETEYPRWGPDDSDSVGIQEFLTRING
jgi:hypothetical protein